jgi:cytochrome bd-type quinol oxidase subunit 2
MNRYKSWIASIATLLVLVSGLSAPVLAQDIQSGLCAGANFQFTDNPSGADCSENGGTNARFTRLIHTIVNLLSAIVGVVAVIMIIVGGLRYITSGGNDTSVTSAKNTILYAIIGLIIVALAQVIVRFTLNKITNG